MSVVVSEDGYPEPQEPPIHPTVETATNSAKDAIQRTLNFGSDIHGARGLEYVALQLTNFLTCALVREFGQETAAQVLEANYRLLPYMEQLISR